MTKVEEACLVIGAGDDTGAAIGRAFAREGMVSCLVRRARHADDLEAKSVFGQLIIERFRVGDEVFFGEG